MIEARLIRIESCDSCMKGVLTVEGKFVCMTLEPPWKDNAVGKSCIPAGSYLCKRTRSPKFLETFVVLEVPGRSHILFHAGNKPEDTSGCILVGKSLEKDVCYIRDSRVTRSVLMDVLKNVDEFELTIVEV